MTKIKILLLLAFIIIVSCNIIAQTNEELNKLKSMGVTDDMIKKAMQQKSQNNTIPDTGILKNLNIQKPLINDKKATTSQKADTSKTDSLLTKEPPEKKPKYPKGRIFGQDLFRNENLSIYERAREVIAPPNYILGVGDEISISVWGMAEYSDVFTINETGSINMKQVGRIYLKGLTFERAKALIRSKLNQFIDKSSTHCDITLTYSRVITVNIVGEVFNPGSYRLAAVNTAFNALIASGGPNQEGSVRNIYIKRNGVIVDSLDVYKFLMNKEYNLDIFLQNNDYIIVPLAKRIAKINGCVRRPHTYELKPNENLKSLIEYAGGVTSSAYTKNIQVRRYNDNQYIILDIKYDSLIKAHSDFEINEEDSVNVNKVPNTLMNTVKANGSFKIPGNYELKPNERITDLLKRTEGLAFDAYTDNAYLIRLNEDMSKYYIPINLTSVLSDVNSKDNLVLKDFDELNVLSKNDFKDEFLVTVTGAVRTPKEIKYGNSLTLKDALYMCGGIKQQAELSRVEVSRVLDFDKKIKQTTPIRSIVYTVEVKKDLSISKDAENFLLNPYDIVFVRSNPDFEIPKLIRLEGEVKYPGEYNIMSKDEKLSDVIKRAGGLTKYASENGASMYRKWDNIGNIYIDLKKAINRQKSKYNIVLYGGDSITIPKTLDLVNISGAINDVENKTVSAPYFNNKRAKDYIINFAGGFNENSDRRHTSVVYPNGITKGTRDFGIFRVYPKIVKGAKIKVPMKEVIVKKERTPVDWNTVIEKLTVKATALLTLFLIIKNIK
ncbi:MAG: SLBB domain-containing protein [Bacteroidota bacterium]|nr:SLBB domain-containing protein [Bacteroidota bacterium]